jgi:hypothetical protein
MNQNKNSFVTYQFALSLPDPPYLSFILYYFSYIFIVDKLGDNR